LMVCQWARGKTELVLWYVLFSTSSFANTLDGRKNEKPAAKNKTARNFVN